MAAGKYLGTRSYDNEKNGKQLKDPLGKKKISLDRELKPNSGLDCRVCVVLLKRFIRRFLRGFSGGVGLYAGVQIVSALLRNPFRESVPQIWQGVLSKDCAKVAGFFALYPSVYHLLVELLTVLRASKDGWTYSISGGIAGLSVALLDESRRQTLAFFTLSRAWGAGLSTLVTRGHVQSVPFFEVGVFCTCVSLIVYCTALKPEYLAPGYYRSILKWSRDYTDKTLEILFRTPRPQFMTCQEAGLHKGPCVQHRMVDCVKSMPGFAKLYLPIHLTPILVFKRKLIKDRPLYVLKSLLKNWALSTAFLGVMCSLAKLTICVLRNQIHKPPPLPSFIPAVAGAVCGLALLFERYSRRKELSMFVIPHALNILYVAIKRSKFKSWLGIPHGFTLMFAISMTSVMHAYEREPQSLSLLINGLLRFFVGSKTNSSPRVQTRTVSESY